MPDDMSTLYDQRMARYVTAMQNEKPDMVPIRPFAAEFCAKYAGFTNQEVTHDIDKAFEAVLKCAADFDWDATVGNMVYVWTGLVDSVKIDTADGQVLPPKSTRFLPKLASGLVWSSHREP